jgi:hypothetical protein
VCIAESAAPALGYLQPLPCSSQVAQEFAGIDIFDKRATGNINFEIFSGATRHVATGATLPALRAKSPCDAKICKRIHRLPGNQVDAATISAVAAIRPAFRDKFLAAETQTTVATVARLNPYGRFVDEFHEVIPAAFRKARSSGCKKS